MSWPVYRPPLPSVKIGEEALSPIFVGGGEVCTQARMTEIPTDLKSLPRNSFKKSFKGKLFKILESEDSYVEVDALIDKMKN